MEKKKRILGIDLLRIVTMYMIVLIHTTSHGGILSAVSAREGQFAVVWAIEMLVFCSVNIYAMISGYVGYTRTELHISRFMQLWLQVFFYSVLCYLLVGLRMDTFSIKELIKVCIPITTSQYWYFTAYAGVYLISPWINRLIRQMEDREAKRTFGLFISVFIVYVSVAGILYDPFRVEEGYSFVWLAVMYTLGAFIRRLNLIESISTGKAVAGAILCWSVSFLTKMLFPMRNICGKYTSVTMVGLACFLLVIFSKIKISAQGKTGRMIQSASAATFGIYLIHDNFFVRNYFIKDRFAWIAELAPWKIPFAVCGIGAGIFILALMIEMIRAKVQKKIKIF